MITFCILYRLEKSQYKINTIGRNSAYSIELNSINAIN